jgi:hypothetical protein
MKGAGGVDLKAALAMGALALSGQSMSPVHPRPAGISGALTMNTGKLRCVKSRGRELNRFTALPYAA